MRKIFILLLLINICFFNSVSQNNAQNNIFYNSVLNYKAWLLNNNIIQSNNSNVWVMNIYKLGVSENNFEFLLSFTVIKIKPLIFKGYFIVENELVLVNSRAKDTITYKDFNINKINDSIIKKANEKLHDERDLFFDPTYRFIEYKNGKMKIKDLKSFTDLPKKYWDKRAD